MNDATNCRWNNRNANNNGRLVIRVAAEITPPQLIRWSVPANTASPTVSGPVRTELSAHHLP